MSVVEPDSSEMDTGLGTDAAVVSTDLEFSSSSNDREGCPSPTRPATPVPAAGTGRSSPTDMIGGEAECPPTPVLDIAPHIGETEAQPEAETEAETESQDVDGNREAPRLVEMEAMASDGHNNQEDQSQRATGADTAAEADESYRPSGASSSSQSMGDSEPSSYAPSQSHDSAGRDDDESPSKAAPKTRRGFVAPRRSSGFVAPKTTTKAAAPATEPPSVLNTHAKSRKQAVAQAQPPQEQANRPTQPDEGSMDVESFEEMRPADTDGSEPPGPTAPTPARKVKSKEKTTSSSRGVATSSKASGSTKVKPAKDPLKPKRPSPAYQFWCKTVRSNAEYAGMPFGEASKAMGAAWQELDAGTKAPFEAQANEARKQYEEALKSYKPPAAAADGTTGEPMEVRGLRPRVTALHVPFARTPKPMYIRAFAGKKRKGKEKSGPSRKASKKMAKRHVVGTDDEDDEMEQGADDDDAEEQPSVAARALVDGRRIPTPDSLPVLGESLGDDDFEARELQVRKGLDQGQGPGQGQG